MIKKTDLWGWILPITAALLAIIGAFKSGSAASFYLAGALVLLVIYDKIPAKIITTSLIRVVDVKGAVRGLIGWNGVGIQVAVRTEPVWNSAIAWPLLWQDSPSVAFTFGCCKSNTSKGSHDRCPSIGMYGLMAKQSRYYSMNFSYDNEADKPDVHIGVERKEEVNVEGTNYDSYTMCHSFKLS